MKDQLEKTKKELKEILDKTTTSSDLTLGWDRLNRWKERTGVLIASGVSENEAIKFKNAGPKSFSMMNPDRNFRDAVKHYDSHLQALIEDIEANPELYGNREIKKVDPSPPEQSVTPLARLEKICKRFHKVARQLRNRHENRATLEINDEYDVQDLIHALLKIEFEDIRPEEWTPSYAGKSSRMDFLLKQEKVVLEIKRASISLAEKEIGEQLTIDIQKYNNHPECKTLVCFVYDPEGKIGNPIGLITDLEKQSSEHLFVKIIVNPQ